jgi:hypothetical protein
VEIEPAALGKQCLGRRISSMAELEREASACQEERNERGVEARWQFTRGQDEG